MLIPLAYAPILAARCPASCVLVAICPGRASVDWESEFVCASQEFRGNPCRLEGDQHLQCSLFRAPPHRRLPRHSGSRQPLAVQVSRQEALAVVCLHGVASQQGPPLKIGKIVGTSTVIVAGSTGYGNGIFRQFSQGQWEKAQTDRDVVTGQVTVTQPFYTGGKVRATVNRATDTVMAQRANLLAQEESSFANAVNAYVGVIENRQLLQLQINNERVLREQLRSTNDQYRVGEVTRTDVAQAEASLALAIAQRQTAEGNLQTANATYVQIIGYLPPNDLVPPRLRCLL
jgi:Outer membrane efflux protein